MREWLEKSVNPLDRTLETHLPEIQKQFDLVHAKMESVAMEQDKRLL